MPWPDWCECYQHDLDHYSKEPYRDGFLYQCKKTGRAVFVPYREAQTFVYKKLIN